MMILNIISKVTRKLNTIAWVLCATSLYALNYMPAATVAFPIIPYVFLASLSLIFLGIIFSRFEPSQMKISQHLKESKYLAENKQNDYNFEYDDPKIKQELTDFYQGLIIEYNKIKESLPDFVLHNANKMIFGLKDLHENRILHLNDFYKASRYMHVYFKPYSFQNFYNFPIDPTRMPISFHSENYKISLSDPTSCYSIERHPVRIKDAVTGCQCRFMAHLQWAMKNNMLKEVLGCIHIGHCMEGALEILDQKINALTHNQFKFSDLLETALGHYADLIANKLNSRMLKLVKKPFYFKNYNDMAMQLHTLKADKDCPIAQGHFPNIDIVNDTLVNYLFEIIPAHMKKNIVASKQNVLENAYTKDNINKYLISCLSFDEESAQRQLYLSSDELNASLVKQKNTRAQKFWP